MCSASSHCIRHFSQVMDEGGRWEEAANGEGAKWIRVPDEEYQGRLSSDMMDVCSIAESHRRYHDGTWVIQKWLYK